MKIILAPDSFKGSLTAAEACAAMAEGIGRIDADIETLAVPMADGGEGTTDALVTATGGRMIDVAATGPLGEPMTGRFGLLGDGATAVVEMAGVSGLPLVAPDRRNPLHTTTYGTGELMAAALAAGATHLIVGIGGSATTDLGAGMAQAMGVRFFDADGVEMTEPMTGRRLADVEGVDLSRLHPGVAGCRIDVACDVDNPLLGPRGAAAVYGPQKGASADDVVTLEANLAHTATIMEKAIGRSVRDTPGAGAAGGLGAGLLGFCDAALMSGVDIVLAAADLAGRVSGADLVITGEGKIDATTANGKTISGVVRVASAAGVPVIAFAGRVENAEEAASLHLQSVHAIAPADMPTEQAMADAYRLLADATERVIGERTHPD